MSRRPLTRRQRGIALLTVTVTIAVLGAVVSDFGYNARVDLEAAANARDQLRAEYLARSSIQLSRLLIKVQQSVLDPNVQFLGDVQIGDFAPYLIKAFGGDADERAGIGALIGIDVTNMKGLGVGKGASMDVAITAEDGRLNINCGGGLNDQQHQSQLYLMLSALMFPTRYNRMFEQPDSDGQYSTRDDTARAIIDWADVDESRYEPPPASGSGNGEDYRYDAQRDPYRARNSFYDTVEEVNLVRGVGEEWWGSFGEMLTVYGSCKLNVSAVLPENWPLIVAAIRAGVKDEAKSDPTLLDDVKLGTIAQTIAGMSKMTGGFKSVDDFIKAITDPASLVGSLPGASPAPSPPPSSSSSSGAVGIALDPAKMRNLITVGPRTTYRVDATGTIARGARKVQVHIRAVWDGTHFNQNTTSSDQNDRLGTWIYWRQD